MDPSLITSPPPPIAELYTEERIVDYLNQNAEFERLKRTELATEQEVLEGFGSGEK